MHNLLVCAYNSQYFAQTQENVAQSHDRETVPFRNSELLLLCLLVFCQEIHSGTAHT